MPFTFRASLCLLALSLSLIHSPLAQTRPSDESAVRAVVEKYLALYSAEDVDGLMGLWSEKSPDYASLKQNLQQQFAAEDFSLSGPAFSRIKLEAEKASLRAAANLTAVNRKSGQKQERSIARNFDLVREDGRWKLWRDEAAEDDLAEALARAETEAERAELLAGEKELVTVDLVRALNRLGDRFADRRDYPKSLTAFTLANSVAEQVGDKREIAFTLHNLGHVERFQGNYAQAMGHFLKCLAIYEELDDRAAVGRTHLGIGLVHWAQGSFAQALEHNRKSLAIYEARNNRTSIATVLNNMGNIHRDQGDYEQALEYYHKSLAIRQELKQTFGILGSLGNIGVVYSSQGNFAKALEYYQKSLAMSEAENDREGIAITLGNIGVVYRKQGNYEQALDYYQRGLAMSRAINDTVGIAQMLNNIGTAHLLQRNYAEALDYYHKSLAMREESGDRHGTSHTMMALGVIHTARGDYAQAWEYYQKSLAIKEEIGDREGRANVLLLIGKYHNKRGDYSQALDYAERASALAREVGNLYMLWDTRVEAGLAYRALSQADRARLAFEDAVAVIETLRGQVAGGEQAQQRFFEDKISPYHAMVDLLAARNDAAEALVFVERAKARALLDLLYGGRANIVKAMTVQERERERALRAELISLNTQVARLSQRDKPDQARLNELTSLREKARLNYEAFQTSLYAAHPELRVQRGEAPIINAQEIAALLPTDAAALLEYVVTEDKTHLFVITKAAQKGVIEIRAYTVPIKRIDLGEQIEAFRRQLASRDLGFRASAAELYRLLLKPAEAQLRGKTSLIIAPDDTLWDLPFQGLMSRPNRFLIEDAAIGYAPSLTALREMQRRQENQRESSAATTLLALGNPLPGRGAAGSAAPALRGEKLARLPDAEQEVRALRRLYGTAQSRVYTGAEAREDRVKAEAGQARILHFATHGTLNNPSPMYSHLVLAGGGPHEDGLLEAWELMQLDLKADLAVLSACETARGRVGAGEGMIGLSWAMFIAGVPSIVVSQWKVESAGTRDIMVDFHRALISRPQAGKARPAKTEALRRAALRLLRNPATRHPFYWAGFVLIGDGR